MAKVALIGPKGEPLMIKLEEGENIGDPAVAFEIDNTRQVIIGEEEKLITVSSHKERWGPVKKCPNLIKKH